MATGATITSEWAALTREQLATAVIPAPTSTPWTPPLREWNNVTASAGRSRAGPHSVFFPRSTRNFLRGIILLTASRHALFRSSPARQTAVSTEEIMPFFYSLQPNLCITAEPASLTRTKSYHLGPLLALLMAAASLTPAWGQSAASGSARPKAADPTRFTVAAPPPESENAYCDKGNVAKFGAKDGPAELPKTCYYTGLDGTPSPGRQIHVRANSDLAEALEGAKCGDTLLLAAGASFPIKQFPKKNCDDRHYITVRTETPDSKLPPEGTRISPAWGGVAILPGRPPYAQPATGAAKLMATIVVKPEIGVEFGDHYRFIGIEWIPIEGRKIARLLFTNGGDHLIFDRNWVHGTDGVELAHAFGIKDSSYVAVIHSYFNSFTCTAGTGSCTDATAIGGGNGDLSTHALKIVDNFLEASGENFLLGGATSSVVPEDIEIRRNNMFKRMFWNPNSPD